MSPSTGPDQEREFNPLTEHSIVNVLLYEDDEAPTKAIYNHLEDRLYVEPRMGEMVYIAYTQYELVCFEGISHVFLSWEDYVDMVVGVLISPDVIPEIRADIVEGAKERRQKQLN